MKEAEGEWGGGRIPRDWCKRAERVYPGLKEKVTAKSLSSPTANKNSSISLIEISVSEASATLKIFD